VSARPNANPPALHSSGKRRSVPTLALGIAEACAALGVSHAYWQEHVAGEVKIVRRGRRKLVAVAELERWLDANAERTLERRP
jgi:hypothetical protein